MNETDGYKPNYEAECNRCGTSPCVDVIRAGRIAHVSNLCGCCFFNDRSMLDPDDWNQPNEE